MFFFSIYNLYMSNNIVALNAGAIKVRSFQSYRW